MFNIKLKAALIHMLLSLVLYAIVIAVFYWGSYAAPLDQAVGFWPIALLILLTVIVIGPCLAFLVYQPAKSSLKFDLSCIVLLQLAALGYGVHTLYDARPVWLVHSVDRFELIRNNDIYAADPISTSHLFATRPQFSTHVAAVELSQDPKQRQDDLSNAVFSGLTLSMQPSRYVNYPQVQVAALKKAYSLQQLNQFNALADVEKLLKKYPQSQAYIPLRATQQDLVVLVDAKGAIVKIVNLRPWD